MNRSELFPVPRRGNVVVFDVPELGDRSYLVHDGEAGIVVDAQRDLPAYLSAAEAIGVRIEIVLETHIHNDYVSGGLALARRTGAKYVVPRFEAVGFADIATAAGEGDTFAAGALRVRPLATPGHSAQHLAYLIDHEDGEFRLVATGGSLLAGTIGRTDLFGADHTTTLAAAQWRSVRRLLLECGPDTIVLPTHGFGSFCAASPVASGATWPITIAQERARNLVVALGVDEFIDELAQNAMPIPAYYDEIAAQNRVGAGEPALALEPPLRLSELEAELEAGHHLVDLRPRRVYAAAHRVGTWNLELGTNLVTYLGWLLDKQTPVTLLASDEAAVHAARQALAHIGREEIAGWAPSQLLTETEPPSSYRVADFAELAAAYARRERPALVDVRHRHEFLAAHLEGAQHIPLPDVRAHLDELPRDAPVWVHCGAGYRAAVAASVLEAAGIEPVLVDDDFANARAAGLEIGSGEDKARRAG